MIRRAFLWLAAASLAGCASAPRQTSRRLRGRFHLRSASGSGTGRFLITDFSDGSWQFDLRDPMGTTLIRMDIRGAYSTVQAPGLPTLTEDSPERLAEKALGFSLPVQALHDLLADPASMLASLHDYPGWSISTAPAGAGRVRRFTAQSARCRIILIPDQP